MSAGITDCLWPSRPKPKPDESLCSWLARLSAANGISWRTFCSIIGGSHTARYGASDLAPHPRALEILARRTGTDYASIESLSIARYMPLFSQGRTRMWFNRANADPEYDFTRQFCRECIDEAGYCRRQWRFPFIAVCDRHDCALEFYCERCFHDRLGMPFSKLTHSVRCSPCQFSRREITGRALSEAISCQSKLLALLDASFTSSGEHDRIHAVFRGLQFLLENEVTERGRGGRIVKMSAKSRFEMLGPRSRYRMLVPVARLFSSYYDEIIDLCIRIGRILLECVGMARLRGPLSCYAELTRCAEA